MVACSFCSGDVLKGTGIMYSKRDGTLYYFCSSKCKKNQLVLGREGRRHKWTPAYRTYVSMAAKRDAKAEKKEAKPKEAPKKAEAPKAEKKEEKK